MEAKSMRAKLVLAFILILTTACSSIATPTAVFNPSATPSQAATSATALLSTSTPSPSLAPTETSTSAPTGTSPPSSTATLSPSSTATPSPSPTASQPASVEVDFIDVGQGDAILIQSSDGTTVVIDGGEQGSGELSYLQSKHVDHVDLMVATHPHSDHIGGLVDVLGVPSRSRKLLRMASLTQPGFTKSSWTASRTQKLNTSKRNVGTRFRLAVYPFRCSVRFRPQVVISTTTPLFYAWWWEKWFSSSPVMPRPTPNPVWSRPICPSRPISSRLGITGEEENHFSHHQA